MDTLANLLALPFGTLAVLAIGYLGYRVAYVGHDGPHTSVDVVFISLVFSSVAKAIFVLHGPPDILASLPALGATFIAACLWRSILSPHWWKWMRDAGISNHDRGRTVWETMIMRNLNAPTQIFVSLKSGRQLLCDDVRPFDNAPLGPCIFGPDGSIALYVTASRPKSTANWIELTPYDLAKPGWGFDMTFIPAAEIERVRIMRPN